MSDRSYFASWLDPFQTGGIASLLLLTLWQICADTLFLNSFLCTGMAGNYHFYSPAWEWVWPMLDMEFLSPLIPHTSEIVNLLFYKVWATPQAALLLLHAPLTGHLLGRSILCLLPGSFNRMLRFWSKSVESAKKSFPINVRCSLPTRATTQTASKKAIESLQGETLCNLQNSRILCK